MRKLIFIFLLISTPVTLLADSEPYLSFTWEVTDGTGEPVASKDQHYEGSAPITAKWCIKMLRARQETMTMPHSMEDGEDGNRVDRWRFPMW